MPVSSRRGMSRHACIAVLDSTLFLAILALLDPSASTGFVVHEWVGTGFIVLFLVHVLVSWNWIAMTWRRARENAGSRTRINLLLNTALGVMMLVVIVSGLVVSEYVLPAAGVHSGDSQGWEQLHNFTSSLIIPVIGLHTALNWNWIKGALRRYGIVRFGSRGSVAGAEP